ncbi:MAG TPA: lipid-A-disaccharide synthase [Vicinamibacterales bacterium]|nr:lipid-A-disaccharide synthase [Vicinamibacterales bacterium]HXR45282.1 lipid-A-disaccharide synthase [Pseudolysinimonas sp.]
MPSAPRALRILMSCGEPSGDLYAGALVSELRAREPGIEIRGLGGDRFAQAGGTLLAHYRGLSATGLVEPLRVVPRALALIRQLTQAARTWRPDVFVPIDFPDVNFRLMAAMKRLGVPVAYYIGPQLWAWRPWRMRAIQRDASKVIVIFPFEEALYRDAGVPVEFVGHPLVEMAEAAVAGRPRPVLRHELGLDPDKPTIALLPGSRRNELERLVPVIAAAMPGLAARLEHVQFVVACAPHAADALFDPMKQAAAVLRVPLALVRDRADAVLAAADAAVTASGTATVQGAIHGCPMVVIYKLSPLTYRLGKPFVRLDTYAMPNLIAGRRLVAELIQDGCTPPRIVEETLALVEDRERRAAVVDGLRQVRDRLALPGASGRAAEAVLGVARASRPREDR